MTEAVVQPAWHPPQAQHLPPEAFEAQALKGTVLVEVWSQGCGPCRMVSAGLARLLDRQPERFSLLMLDRDADPALAQRLEARSTPTLLLYREGQLLARRSGALIESQLDAWLKQSQV